MVMWFTAWTVAAVLASGNVFEVPIHSYLTWTEAECVQRLPAQGVIDDYDMTYRLNPRCTPVFWDKYDNPPRRRR